jgi:hypothetical protein
MYGQSSLIVSVLLLCMLLTMEAGFRCGRRKQKLTAEAVTQANAVLASMLGLLALLLAFTFSAALQRYDGRSQAVVAEANAIGTTYLRAQLLPKGMHDEVRGLLRQYLDVRIQEGRIHTADTAGRESPLLQTNLMTEQLWGHAVKAAEQDGRPVTSGLFIQSLNELIDAYGIRTASLNRHVPEIVLFLMFTTIVMTTATLGYASRIAGHRVTLAASALVVLISLVVFLIIDLDRPRRGIIQVSQESLLSLQQTIKSAQEHSAQPGNPPDASQAPRR